jgi:hypothetical protein
MGVTRLMDRALARFARRWRLRGDLAGEFESNAERRAAYARTFFRDRESALVLADILRANGLSSDTFVFGPDGRADITAAAYRDGRRATALEILHIAGGDMDALARALVMDDLKETRNDRGNRDHPDRNDADGDDDADADPAS